MHLRFSILITVAPFLLAAHTACAADPGPDHVVILMMENHAYGQVVGSSSAPYINSLTSQGALFTQSYGSTHPSQPNYLILFSGSAQGIIDDTSPPPGAPYASTNMGSALISAGRTFTGYSEDLPSVGYLGVGDGGYVRRHNPWVDWQSASSHAVPAASNRSFSDFPSNFSTLPTVSYVVPNVVHDMHDGNDPADILAADTWVHDHMDAYIQWSKLHNSLFILTFDEDNDTSVNRVLTIFIGSMITTGQYSQRIGQRDILRTIERMYGLTASGSGGVPIDGVWKTPTGTTGSSTGSAGTTAGTTVGGSSSGSATGTSTASTSGTGSTSGTSAGTGTGSTGSATSTGPAGGTSGTSTGSHASGSSCGLGSGAIGLLGMALVAVIRRKRAT